MHNLRKGLGSSNWGNKKVRVSLKTLNPQVVSSIRVYTARITNPRQRRVGGVKKVVRLFLPFNEPIHVLNPDRLSKPVRIG